MKRSTISRETVLAVVEGGAKNMTDVVRALGYSSVCGQTLAKIRTALPDIKDRLSKGVPVPEVVKVAAPAVVESKVKAVEPKVVTPKAVKVKVESKRVEVKARKTDSDRLFSKVLYQTIWEIGHGVEMSRDELIDKATEKSGFTRKNVGYAYRVVTSKNHQSNKIKKYPNGRCYNVLGNRSGRVRLERVEA